MRRLLTLVPVLGLSISSLAAVHDSTAGGNASGRPLTRDEMRATLGRAITGGYCAIEVCNRPAGEQPCTNIPFVNESVRTYYNPGMACRLEQYGECEYVPDVWCKITEHWSQPYCEDNPNGIVLQRWTDYENQCYW